MIRFVLTLVLMLFAGPAAAAAVTELHWTGKATIHETDRTLEIGISTRLEPFKSARSESWLLSQGKASARTLVIEPGGGWVDRNGARDPLPEPMVRHERQQYALYGLMLRALGNDTAPVPDYAPPTRFEKDAAGALASASNEVLDPEGAAAPIPQTIRFSGRTESNGVVWPSRIDIYERGKLYFTLEIDSFEAVRD